MTQDSNPNFNAPPSAEFALGRVLSGRYRVDKVLGGGGMGVILAGWHIELGQRVAIKALRPEALADPEIVARFTREARALARIKSEHVARVLDVGKEGIHPFMVMEYLRGSDLSVLQKSHGRFSVDEALTYVLQASEAIAEAHQVGIVHRDIKPANLFLTKRADGSPLIKVLDFGISKLIDPASQLTTEDPLTKTAMMMGSPHYMPPEQLKNARDADARADIWSLGVVLHRLLTGEHAFTAATSAELCVAVLVGEHASLLTRRPDAPAGLAAVIDTCLAKDPAARYRTIAELAHALGPYAPAAAQVSIERIARTDASSAVASIPPPEMTPPGQSANDPPPIPEGATATSVDVHVGGGTKVTSLTSTQSLQKSAGIPKKRTGLLIVIGAGVLLSVFATSAIIVSRAMTAHKVPANETGLAGVQRTPDAIPPPQAEITPETAPARAPGTSSASASSASGTATVRAQPGQAPLGATTRPRGPNALDNGARAPADSAKGTASAAPPPPSPSANLNPFGGRK